MDDDPVTDEVRSTYDTVAEVYASRFPGTEPEAAVELAMLDHLVERLGTGTRDVLDAGCGTGRIARYLADRGCAVQGVDLSPGMLAMARRDHPDIPTQVASITDLPFADVGFDAVVLWYSVIHVADADLPRVFAEARRVLRPGGLVLVAFQAGVGTRDVGEGFRRLGFDVTLTRYHRTPDEVAGALATAGFVEQARLVRRPITEKDDQAFLLAAAPSGQ